MVKPSDLIITNNYNPSITSVSRIPRSDHHLSFQLPPSLQYLNPTILQLHWDLETNIFSLKLSPLIFSLPFLPSLNSRVNHYNYSLMYTLIPCLSLAMISLLGKSKTDYSMSAPIQLNIAGEKTHTHIPVDAWLHFKFIIPNFKWAPSCSLGITLHLHL